MPASEARATSAPPIQETSGKAVAAALTDVVLRTSTASASVANTAQASNG